MDNWELLLQPQPTYPPPNSTPLMYTFLPHPVTRLRLRSVGVEVFALCSFIAVSLSTSRLYSPLQSMSLSVPHATTDDVIMAVRSVLPNVACFSPSLSVTSSLFRRPYFVAMELAWPVLAGRLAQHSLTLPVAG